MTANLPRSFTVGELKALPPGTVLDTTTNFRWMKLVRSTPMTEGAWMFAPLPEERRGWTGGVIQMPRPDLNGPVKAVYRAGSLVAFLRILEMADAKPRAHGVTLWIALPFDEDARADLIRVAEENEAMVRGVIREVGRAATGHLYDIAELGLSTNMLVAELGAATRSNPAPMEVQAILFDRELWTPRRAESWLRRHDYAGLDVDVKPNTYRYRQHDPDLFRPSSFRTIAFGEETGIQAVVGKRKGGARSNPAKLSDADERELDLLVGRIGDNIAEIVHAGRSTWDSLEQAVRLHEGDAEQSWREHGGRAPFRQVWPRVEAQTIQECAGLRDLPGAFPGERTPARTPEPPPVKLGRKLDAYLGEGYGVGLWFVQRMGDPSGAQQSKVAGNDWVIYHDGEFVKRVSSLDQAREYLRGRVPPRANPPREMETRTVTIHGDKVMQYHVETEAHRQELLNLVETARRVLEKQKDRDPGYRRRLGFCNDMAAVVRMETLPFWVNELPEWAGTFKTWYSPAKAEAARRNPGNGDGVLERVQRLDGARYFSEDALQHAVDESGERSRTTVVAMSPDDFLRLAERGHDVDKAAGVEAALRARSAFRDVPFLTFRNLGDDAVVTGHEGRHRAMALERRGVQLIPVRLVSQEYRAIPIRWSQWQDAPPQGEVWPARLWPEGTDEATITLDAFETRRGRTPWVPFPDSLLFPRR